MFIFQTKLLKGAQGDRGEAGQANSVPTGAIVGLEDGADIPDGYEEASEPASWIKKVAETPLTTIAKVIDSLQQTANAHNNAPSINAVNEALEDVNDAINNYWETIYPVGSIFMNFNSTSPATLFGGTWERLEDTFLVGASSTRASESTGGAFTKSYTPAGSIGGHSLTTDELPSHSHTIPALSGTASSTGSGHQHTYYVTGFTQSNATQGDAGSVSDEVWTGYKTGNESGTGADEGAHSHSVTTNASTTGSAGSGTSHNHSFTGTQATIDVTPPYTAVYMWKRTA